MKSQKKNSGMSMVEMLGVVGVILILAVLSIPGFKNITSGAKKSVASRNVATLNSAIEQFNQAGGLMTSQVPMQIASSADEMEVFCHLTSQEQIGKISGQFLSSVQKPVISSDPSLYKAVWVSDYDNGKATKYASGARDPALEKLLAAGTIKGGRFEIVGPGLSITTPKGVITSSAPGIIAFSKDGAPCSTILAVATPKPIAGTTYKLTLGVSPAGAGTVTGAGTFNSGTSAAFTATAGANYTFDHWDRDLGGLGAIDKITMNSDKNGTAYFMPKTVTVQLDALPVNAGTTTGSGTYNSNTQLAYTATPTLPGYKFLNWTGPDAAKLIASPGSILLTSDIKATANFAENLYTVTIGTPTVKTTSGYLAVNNAATVEPGTIALNFRQGDTLNLKSTPAWQDTWGQTRYRWETFQLKDASTTTETKGSGSSPTTTWSLSQGIASDLTITPIVVQQQLIKANSNNTLWGSVTLNGNNSQGILSIFDKGTVVNLIASPNTAIARFVDWSNGNTNASISPTLNADTDLTANFSDQQYMTVKVIDQFDGTVPAKYYSFSNGSIKAGKNQYTIGTTPTATFTLTDTKIYEYTSIENATATGGPDTYTVTSSDPIVYNSENTITIKLKVNRQLMVYWAGSQYGELDGGAKATITASGLQSAMYSQAGVYPITYGNGSGNNDYGTYVTAQWDSFVEWRHTNPGDWANSLSSAIYNHTIQYQELYYHYDNYIIYYYPAYLVVYDKATNTIMGTLPGSNIPQVTSDKAAETLLAAGFPGEYLGYYAQNVPTRAYQTGYNWWSGPWYGSYQWQSGWWNSLSPIIVDLSKTGKPDLLAGPVWWDDPQRVPVIDALRLFDLDGQGPKYWEWVGPKAGILVWNPSGSRVFQPTGKDLFGNVTWGKTWKDGYEPLATLDLNNNGTLETDESKDIWVWRDLNSNAIVEEGELTPLAEQNISTIVVKAEYKNGALNTIGAIVDGQPAPTWDWISLGGSVEAPVTAPANEPTVYQWRMDDQLMPVGGNLIFTKTADGISLKSVPGGQKEGMEAKAAVDGNIISWTFGPLNTKAKIKGNTLQGESTMNGTVMTWSGIKVSGPNIFSE